MKTHKDLQVWNEAIEFVTDIYKMTKEFPPSQQYGLSSQMERAACSIPSNISEGFSRRSEKEKIKFLYYSLGSNSEIETQLIIAYNLNYIDLTSYKNQSARNTVIGKMLIKLIRSIGQ